MDARLKVAARWLLVLVTFAATSVALFIFLMGLMLWPDRSVVATFTAIGIAPRSTIETVHRLDFLITLFFWVIPLASAIGFAARRPQRRALTLGFSIVVLLFATICFFWGRQDNSAFAEGISVVATLIVLSAALLSIFKWKSFFPLTIVNYIAILLLFSPSIAVLSRGTRKLVQPKELWSTTLQQDQWQSMNTGSEYAATRQVAFAGDRVIAVFDAGFGSTQPSKDQWPVAKYRLISLDLKTGLKLREITITGRWGSMPYIYPTPGGVIDLQSDPPLTLNPDLVTVTDAPSAAPADRVTTRQRLECGGANCDPARYILGKNTLHLKQKRFQVVDSTGHILGGGDLIEWGAFAGASADGRRFAIQSSFMEGDPDFVVYEYFTIYEATTGKPLAMIHTTNLPARQSWSALSSDGRYFVAGNPNKLSLYELP
jgi:hypothetical protein